MAALDKFGGRLLVIFDGHCGLCNRSIRWFLRRDRKDRLRFTPSESEEAARLLARRRFAWPDSLDGPDTIVVVRGVGRADEEILLRSEAVLVMLSALPQPWPALGGLCRVVPRGLRDLVYRGIARIRYRVWGRYDACPIPTEDERKHFV